MHSWSFSALRSMQNQLLRYNRRWLRFSFSPFSRCDVLRGLDYPQNAGIKGVQPAPRIALCCQTQISVRLTIPSIV
jgi:hypothetical protein